MEARSLTLRRVQDRRRNRPRRRIVPEPNEIQGINDEEGLDEGQDQDRMQDRGGNPGNQNEVLARGMRDIMQELTTMRRSIQLQERSIAQLQNDMVQYGRAGAAPQPQLNDDDIRRRLVEENQRRRPGARPQEARQSIRLIRETSRINNVKFEGNVVKCNPKKLVRNFEENAATEGLSEREKLSAFTGILKGDAAQWLETLEVENYQGWKI